MLPKKPPDSPVSVLYARINERNSYESFQIVDLHIGDCPVSVECDTVVSIKLVCDDSQGAGVGVDTVDLVWKLWEGPELVQPAIT